MTAKATAESGSALLLVVMWMFAVTVMTMTILTISLKYAAIQDMLARQRQAYWLARSEARSVVQGLKNGTPAANTWSDIYPFGTADVQLSYSTLWNVRIESHVSGAIDTLTFSYNPGLAKITSWQDNGAG